MGRSRRGGRRGGGGGTDGIRGSLQGAQPEYLPMLQRVCGVTGPTFEGQGGTTICTNPHAGPLDQDPRLNIMSSMFQQLKKQKGTCWY